MTEVVLPPPLLLLSTARRAIPYRGWLLCLLVASNIVYSAYMGTSIPVPVMEGVDIPDACITGYYYKNGDDEDHPHNYHHPNDVVLREWYEAIGPSGRRGYLLLALLDVTIIIPCYWFLFTAHLLHRRCRPEGLCYVPTLAATFDLFETAVHAYAVATHHPSSGGTGATASNYATTSMSHLPSSPFVPPLQVPPVILEMASSATRHKFGYLAFTLLLVVFVSIRPLPRRTEDAASETGGGDGLISPPKPPTTDEPASSSSVSNLQR
jgi:hypothetical protein